MVGETETIRRNCFECGRRLDVELGPDGTILSEVEYFGEISLPIPETGKYQETDHGVGWTEDDELETHVPLEHSDEYDDFFRVTEWTGEKEEHEYWICERCSND